MGSFDFRLPIWAAFCLRKFALLVLTHKHNQGQDHLHGHRKRISLLSLPLLLRVECFDYTPSWFVLICLVVDFLKINFYSLDLFAISCTLRLDLSSSSAQIQIPSFKVFYLWFKESNRLQLLHWLNMFLFLRLPYIAAFYQHLFDYDQLFLHGNPESQMFNADDFP